jgi:pimeloyl-ACP methyl ester carboxylesterase
VTSDVKTFDSRNGSSIACHVCGDGPPLVLVHGTSADHIRWMSVIEPLAARFTTYAVDRRGRGASSDAEPLSVEAEFDDVAAIVETIGGEVDLLGHSYGAVCCLEAALRTSHVRRLVLYEPPLPLGIEIYPPGLIERLEALLAGGDRESVVMTFLSEVVRMPPAELGAVQRDSSWAGRVAAAHTIPRELRMADVYKPDFRRFGTLRVPTLLLVGGDSPAFLVAPAARLQREIAASKLTTMAGQQHVAMTTAPRGVPQRRHRLPQLSARSAGRVARCRGEIGSNCSSGALKIRRSRRAAAFACQEHSSR